MLFKYKALDQNGESKEGTIEAVNIDVAINSLQKRNLILSAIDPVEEKPTKRVFFFGKKVPGKDVVILSRQLATLFDAQVSALRVFKLISAETENPILRKSLTEVADDIQGGSSISKALGKHPKIFSEFYVSMIKAGEETGKLNDSFSFLADYLDRNYEVTSKVKNALVYPIFVITVFIGVMVLMFTMVVPKIADILLDSGQELPFYTKVVIAMSSFFVNYGVFLLAILVIAAFFFVRYSRTEQGKIAIDSFKMEIPVIGDLYHKLYLSIIADNMHTMVLSGIPMLQAIEITATVVGNNMYSQILNESQMAVKGGSSLSASLSQYPEIPGILVQMIKVGEETGELGSILKTMAKFYQREVINAVDTLVGLIEPVMIVVLGLGVGILLASVLLPIYNIAGSAGI
jgi:type IV pilus assembly protein PilC